MSLREEVHRRHSSDSRYSRRDLDLQDRSSRRSGSPTLNRIQTDLHECAHNRSGSPNPRSNIRRYDTPGRRSTERSSPMRKTQEPPTTRVRPELADTLLECEKNVVAYMANLRGLSTFPFPIEFPREPITWRLLVECLHKLLDLGSRDVEVAITLGHAHEAKKIAAGVKAMKVRLDSLDSLYSQLPQGLIVDEDHDRLQLRSARLRGKAPVTESADAATQDDPTCIRGLRLLTIEFAELGIVKKSYTPVKAPQSRSNWLSTLDSLETMLKDHQPEFRGRTLQMRKDEQTLWLRECIRIRGWIVSARRKQGLAIR